MKRLLYGIVMLCFMDLFIQLPVMGPFAKSLGAGSFMIGLAVGLYSLTNMFGNIAAGYWIDRYGARNVLLLGFFLTAGVMLLYPLVNQPLHLIVVRFIHGLTGGLLVPSAFTLISHQASGQKPGRAMALSGAAVGAAAIVGPAVAGIVKAKLGLQPLFIGTSILLALGGLIVVVAVSASRVKQITRKIAPASSDSLAGFEVILRKKPVVQSYIGAFSLMFAMGALTYALPLKVDELDFAAQISGLLLSTFGVVAIIVFVMPTNRWFDRVSPLTLMCGGGAIIMLSLLLLSFLNDQMLMFSVMGLYGFGFSLLFPSMNALLINNVSVESKGRAFGLFYAFFSLGVVVGSSGIGALTANYDIALRMAAGFILLAGCIVALLQHAELRGAQGKAGGAS
ncbi:MFS transporter [Paenibacillus lentus]|uniref:MFS transporter n=1 Tax=Paenibacillus lentus TaxID=1338368 RepID=A0A3Q8SA89_9BACL|nr:MFS transporter [Paenibacillus lentus]AZK45988.1 MFS transporter [Paenibacillus lentus]